MALPTTTVIDQHTLARANTSLAERRIDGSFDTGGFLHCSCNPPHLAHEYYIRKDSPNRGQTFFTCPLRDWKNAGTFVSCRLYALRRVIQEIMPQTAQLAYPPPRNDPPVTTPSPVPIQASTEAASQGTNASSAQDAHDAAMDALIPVRTPTTPAQRTSQATDGHAASAGRWVRSNEGVGQSRPSPSSASMVSLSPTTTIPSSLPGYSFGSPYNVSSDSSPPTASSSQASATTGILHSSPTKSVSKVTKRSKKKAPARKLDMDSDAITDRLLDAVKVDYAFVPDEAKAKLQKEADKLADVHERAQEELRIAEVDRSRTQGSYEQLSKKLEKVTKELEEEKGKRKVEKAKRRDEAAKRAQEKAKRNAEKIKRQKLDKRMKEFESLRSSSPTSTL